MKIRVSIKRGDITTSINLSAHGARMAFGTRYGLTLSYGEFIERILSGYYIVLAANEDDKKAIIYGLLI